MADSYFSDPTLDDLMRSVIEEILLHGDRINPSRGECTELTGVLLELTNPRARLSRTETRGRPFSCLGELCWYLARSNELEFIVYYISEYRQNADGPVIFGGYGPRLFSHNDNNQVANVINLLRGNPESRRAVIQLFDAADITKPHNDIPCTCTLQFLIRRNALHLVTYMRSNDAFWGLPHDVFCFTMLQEIVARTLAVELGTYKHAVGSLHLYDRHREAAQQFLDEGWQSTQATMPPMPQGDPWSDIESLLQAESAIRKDEQYDTVRLGTLDPFWADLIRLLQVYRCSKRNEVEGILALRRAISSPVYLTFIDKKLNECRQRSGQ